MTDPRPPIRPRDDDWPETRDYHREQADEIARLREALRVAQRNLERLLLEFDFMIERNVIIDVLNDVIFDDARAAITKINEALDDER